MERIRGLMQRKSSINASYCSELLFGGIPGALGTGPCVVLSPVHTGGVEFHPRSVTLNQSAVLPMRAGIPGAPPASGAASFHAVPPVAPERALRREAGETREPPLPNQHPGRVQGSDFCNKLGDSHFSALSWRWKETGSRGQRSWSTIALETLNNKGNSSNPQFPPGKWASMTARSEGLLRGR